MMLTIRKEQMEVLSKVEACSCEDRRLEHIRTTFPNQFANFGEQKTREMIRYGVKRAANYGFKDDPGVLNYVEVMVLFGRDFDKDKQLPWAAQILGKHKKPAVKIAALHEEAIKRWKCSQIPAAD